MSKIATVNLKRDSGCSETDSTPTGPEMQHTEMCCEYKAHTGLCSLKGKRQHRLTTTFIQNACQNDNTVDTLEWIILWKLISPASFHLFNVATGKYKITYVACVIFALDRAGLKRWIMKTCWHVASHPPAQADVLPHQGQHVGHTELKENTGLSEGGVKRNSGWNCQHFSSV